MKNTFKKMAAVFITAMVITTSLSACKESSDTSGKATSSSQPGITAEEKTQGITYPVKTDVTLTFALLEESQVTSSFKSLGETPFGQELQKKTGIKVNFKYVANNDAMNLMFASGDLSDIISYNFSSYLGGATKAIKDKIIYPLNDIIKKNAPDLNQVINGNDLYRKADTTAEGKIIGFPFIRGDEVLLAGEGIYIREDWLKDLNMEVPTTTDELYTVLKAFKDKKGATVPLSAQNGQINSMLAKGIITSAFGLVKADFYQKDGTVYNGNFDLKYKEALAFMNKLYKEGLLDPNYTTVDANTQNSNFMNGQSGLTYTSVGGGLGSYLKTMEKKDPKFSAVAVTPLVKTEQRFPCFYSLL